MKIILGFEHVRRLVGAHSHLVTALGQRLAARGHDVTIVCDTVTDPVQFPELRFVARRPSRRGESHRLVQLRRWAVRVVPALDHDVSLSFFPAIPGDIVSPIFGWIAGRLHREHRLLRRPLRHAAIQFHKNVIERRLVESAMRADSSVRCILALSEEMARALVAGHPRLTARITTVPGASPIQPPDAGADALAAMRLETRRRLGFAERDDDERVIFLWAAVHALHHGRANLLKAFSQVTREHPNRVGLILASDGHWPTHALAVERGCDEHVRVIGRTKSVDQLLAACDVRVNPAIHSVLGRSVWEALAFGRPVLASSNSAGTERMRDADRHLAGQIVSAYDADAIRDALLWFLQDKNRRSATRSAQLIAPSMRFGLFVDRLERLLQEHAR